MKVDINTQNRLKTARIKMSKICPSHKANKTWPMVRLGDVCEIIAGQSPEGSYYTDESCYTEFHQGSKSFGIRELQVSGVYTKKETKIAKPGSLLISVRAPVGDLNVTTRRVCIGRGLAALIPDDSLSRDFLWLFLTSATKAVNDAAGAGSCFSSLSRSQLSGLEIPLPPLSEQKEIVARLERELAAVEKMKKGFEALAETAKAEFKAELKEVFEELKSGGAESGTVETRRLGEICEFMTSGSRGWAKYYSDSGELFITIKNVKDCAIDVHQVQHVKPPNGAETERTRVKEGDLLISITADLGRTGVVTKAIEAAGAYINQHLICIRLKKDMMLPMFAAYYVESEDGKKQIAHRNKDAVKAGLNFASVSSILLPFPSLSVQRQIVARLSAAKARAEKLEAKAREGVAVCETMRKAILKEAFDCSVSGEGIYD